MINNFSLHAISDVLFRYSQFESVVKIDYSDYPKFNQQNK